MITECRDYLMQKVSEASRISKPYTSLKRLKATQESHVAAVLYQEETLTRDGSKRLRMIDGDSRMRTKVFNRDISFSVIFGEYTQEAAEQIYERFLLSLDKGIYIAGNWVPVEPELAEWIDKEDSILKAEVSVQLKVSFSCGIYKDTELVHVNDIDVKVEKKED